MALLPNPGISNLSASIQNILQPGFLIKSMEQALYPNLAYRESFTPFETPVHLGQTFTFTRKGLLPIVQSPLTRPADTDLTSGLTSQVSGKEQYSVTMNEYAQPVTTNLLTSSATIVDLFKENAEDLGLNAGQSLDVQSRRRGFLAYNGGRTYVTTAAGPTTSVALRNVAGFDFLYVNGVPVTTSVANPHPVTVTESGVPTTRNITAVTAGTLNTAEDTVPGTVTMSANVTVIVGDSVISNFAPDSIRPNNRSTAQQIIGTDIMTMKHLTEATARLRAKSVPKHDDGYYHAILDPLQVSQLWEDPAFQRAYQSLPESEEFRQGMAGVVGGVKIFESPQTPSGNNQAGIKVNRAIITGKEFGFEARYAGMAKWLSMSGLSATGTVMYSPDTHVALIVRTPLDVLQQVVTNTWSFIGDWVCATDSLVGGAQYYKRGIVIETA